MMDEEEFESRPSAPKKKKKVKSHNHIGPNAKAYGAGSAFCPVCDADRILRLTERERDLEKAARDGQKTSGYKSSSRS